MLAGVSAVPRRTGLVDIDADDIEYEPVELSENADIGDSADTIGAPAQSMKIAEDTPTIHIPPSAAQSRPVEPLQIRTTPRTPSDGLPPPILTPPGQAKAAPSLPVVAQTVARPPAAPTEFSVGLTQHPKHGFGLDVSDALTITSVR